MKRNDFLSALKLASIGLSKTGLIEQSDCFIIRKGVIRASNDEICVRVRCAGTEDFSGAVPGLLLLKLVQSFPDDEFEVRVVDPSEEQFELVLSGSSKSAGISCRQIKETGSVVPKADKFSEVPEWLIPAIVEASKCCNNDQLSGVSTCVHLSPSVVESCDNTRLFRREGDTGLSGDFYIHCASAAELSGIPIKGVAISGGWCHFRTSSAQIAVRGREFESFPKLAGILKFDGVSLQLPESLADVVNRCSIMADGDDRISLVTLSFNKGKIRVSSKGTSGWYKEKIDLPEGTELPGKVQFSINPSSLVQILKHKEIVVIGDTRMRVALDGGSYCCSLQQASEE